MTNEPTSAAIERVLLESTRTELLMSDHVDSGHADPVSDCPGCQHDAVLAAARAVGLDVVDAAPALDYRSLQALLVDVMRQVDADTAERDRTRDAQVGETRAGRSLALGQKVSHLDDQVSTLTRIATALRVAGVALPED